MLRTLSDVTFTIFIGERWDLSGLTLINKLPFPYSSIEEWEVRMC